VRKSGEVQNILLTRSQAHLLIYIDVITRQRYHYAMPNISPLVLTDYQVDPVRGFLPSQNPVQHLPSDFHPWEQTAANLSALIIAGQLRKTIARLPVPDLKKLETEGQFRRAMLLLSIFGNAYVWGEAPPVKAIPHTLAVPWAQVAEHVGRPMIISHASVVLDNWRLLEEQGPLVLENIGSLQLFLGGMDEAWFYLITVALEARGAASLPVLASLQHAVETDRIEEVIGHLKSMATIIQDVSAALQRVYEKCAPYVFYHRVRPFLAGWDAPGMIYEGVSNTPVMLFGGSAAQSSLFQAIDAGLGIKHVDEKTRPFLMGMRHYMPPPHRRFIEALEAGPSVHQYVLNHQASSSALANQYNACIDLLSAFRKQHLEITVRYIKQQAQPDADALGTGGTDFVPFLSEARKETQSKAIGDL
jgi:indoleamine 2,3-dioxygenase